MDVRGALQVAGLPRSREAAKPRREMRGSCEWSVVSQVSRGRGSAGVVPEGLGVCCLLIRLQGYHGHARGFAGGWAHAKPRREMQGICQWSVVSQASRGRESAGVVPEGLGVCCLLIRLQGCHGHAGGFAGGWAHAKPRSREGKCRGFVSGQLSVRRAVDGSPRVWFLRVSVCAVS